MEQLNPAPYPSRPVMPPPMGNPNPLMMGLPNPNMAMPRALPSNYAPDQDVKKQEFAKGIFVSGFEDCITTAMLMRHFSIKPINGLKHPRDKLQTSKGFAFIYYGSEDDAIYVKKTLDRSTILKKKIRVTRTVIS